LFGVVVGDRNVRGSMDIEGAVRGEREHRRNGYLPGVDGLRALAVLAVVAYHAGFSWAPGGFLGVDLFFVISGFLITGLLASDWDKRNRIDLPRFWVRRARRLFPALAVMVVVVVALAELVDRAGLSQLRGDVSAAATYTSNWWQIAEQHSYYARFAPPSLLQHLWSLAIEEQFYLVWPLILVAGLCCLSRQRLTYLVVWAALASAVVMALLYRPGQDPSRVYFGTDTHATGLLIGAALALAWPTRKGADPRPRVVRWKLDALGLCGLVVVLAGFRYLGAFDSFTYRGGLTVVSFGAAALVAVAATPGTFIGKLFSLSPLRWLGVRSYGVYLWHWPVLVFTGSVRGETATVGLTERVALVVLTVLLAAVSYTYVERPVRLNGFKRTLRSLADVLTISPTARRPAMLVPTSLVAVILGLAVIGLLSPVPTTDSAAAQIAQGLRAINDANGAATSGESATGAPAPGATSATGGTQPPMWAVAPPRAASPPPAPVLVSAIGDSVMLASATELQKQIPRLAIDAAVGRYMWQVPAVVRALRSSLRLGHVTVLAIGSNGPVTRGQLRNVIDELGPHHRLVLVNTYIPLSWEHSTNILMARTAKKYRSVSLVDWHHAAATHPGLMYGDGVHPLPAGAAMYARLVAAAVQRAEHHRSRAHGQH
jgi:peptidoglycan/LPS O-acetylase OafA/YrhL